VPGLGTGLFSMVPGALLLRDTKRLRWIGHSFIAATRLGFVLPAA